MISLALAYLLQSAPAATAAWQLTAAIESAHQSRVERAAKTARISAWLTEVDEDRAQALARGRKVSPFEDDARPDPFESPSPRRLFWWATSEGGRGQ